MIVVVGAGPAGIAAAVRAHECGAQVTVIDDNAAPGGQIWRGNRDNAWLARFHALKPGVIPNARVIDGDSRTLLVETAEGSREIVYDRLILATGAREIFLPFPGWTLPGVTGAGGLQALAKSGLPVAGKKIVVGGSGPLLLAVAAYLRKQGARVLLIAEQAAWSSVAGFARQLLGNPSKLIQGAGLGWRIAGVPYMAGCWVESAEGNARLERVALRRANKTWTEECDYAAIGYGLYPNNELSALLGLAGIGGTGGVDLSIVEGEMAGYEAAGQSGRARELQPRREKARRFAAAVDQAFALRDELKKLAKPDTFVCRCEDVTYRRLSEHTSFRAAKLHTRCGMGPCQARICGPATEFLFGWRPESVRPPVFPSRIGSLLPDTTTKAK